MINSIMVTTTLRRTGGSSTLTIPRVILEMLGWKVGDVLRLEISKQELIIAACPDSVEKPSGKPRRGINFLSGKRSKTK